MSRSDLGKPPGRVGIRGWAIAVLVVFALAGLAAAELLRHVAHARFTATIRVLPEPVDCIQVTRTRYGYGSASAPAVCVGSENALWVDLTVVNEGHRLGFLKECAVDGLDQAGRAVFASSIKLGHIHFPAGTGIEPGTSVTLRWFVPVTDVSASSPAPRGSVYEYVVSCQPIEYHGQIPV